LSSSWRSASAWAWALKPLGPSASGGYGKACRTRRQP
jgi:hypothetical protein